MGRVGWRLNDFSDNAWMFQVDDVDGVVHDVYDAIEAFSEAKYLQEPMSRLSKPRRRIPRIDVLGWGRRDTPAAASLTGCFQITPFLMSSSTMLMGRLENLRRGLRRNHQACVNTTLPIRGRLITGIFKIEGVQLQQGPESELYLNGYVQDVALVYSHSGATPSPAPRRPASVQPCYLDV